MISDIVIYADVLFGINFLADFIVLLVTVRVMKYSAGLPKIVASAALGALWSVICMFIPVRFALPEKLVTYVPVTLLMVMIVQGKPELKRQETSKQIKLYMRKLLKGAGVMVVTALVAGGLMHGLKYTFAGFFIESAVMNDSELVLFLALSMLVTVLIADAIRRMRTDENVRRRIVIGVSGCTLELDAIIDTGNTLVDYVGRRPVTVVERTYFDSILSDIDNLPKLGYHLIPYNCVGESGGMMEIITADYIHIYDGEKTREYEHAAIGMSRKRLNLDGEFQALLARKMLN